MRLEPDVLEAMKQIVAEGEGTDDLMMMATTALSVYNGDLEGAPITSNRMRLAAMLGQNVPVYIANGILETLQEVLRQEEEGGQEDSQEDKGS